MGDRFSDVAVPVRVSIERMCEMLLALHSRSTERMVDDVSNTASSLGAIT